MVGRQDERRGAQALSLDSVALLRIQQHALQLVQHAAERELVAVELLLRQVADGPDGALLMRVRCCAAERRAATCSSASLL